MRQTEQDSTTPAPSWLPTLLGQVSDAFEVAEPHEIISWARETFGEGLSLGTAFGASGMVLIDIAMKVDPEIDIFYIDTGLFFDETYALIKKIEARYGRKLRAVTPAQSVAEQNDAHGHALWRSDSDNCCLLRKVIPMHQALSDRAGWMTALRRDQSASRANTPIIAMNKKFDVVKVSPLANWTERQVWQYIFDHGLDYNPLHDQGYPSIGCKPCTSSVNGETDDLRAGRWTGSNKTECGLHL